MEKAQKIIFENESVKGAVSRAEWHGGPFTVVRYVYQPGAVFPSHRHESAQVTTVLSGNMVFMIEGEEISMDVGDTIYIPGNMPHSAVVPRHGDGVLSINIFHPPRREHP